jgi:hypothetical protein
MSRSLRRWTAAAAAALGLVAVPFSVATMGTPALSRAACPTGEISDDEDPGWQCQSECPPGMLIDAETNICVAAPGVPPPPLPAQAGQEA